MPAPPSNKVMPCKVEFRNRFAQKARYSAVNEAVITTIINKHQCAAATIADIFNEPSHRAVAFLIRHKGDKPQYQSRKVIANRILATAPEVNLDHRQCWVLNSKACAASWPYGSSRDAVIDQKIAAQNQPMRD